MHIVLANHWYPPETGGGGVATYNHAVAHAYQRLGHQVTVVASRYGRDVPGLADDDGVRVLRLLVTDHYRLRRLPLACRLYRPLSQLHYARRLAQALCDVQGRQAVDVVECAEINAEGFFYARRPRTAIVVRCHTPTFVLARHYGHREVPYDTRITAWAERDLIRRAHSLSAPSSDTGSVVARECGLHAGMIKVVPNALEASAFAPAKDECGRDGATVLYVGRLDRLKGVGVLAEAIPGVIRTAPSTRFVFAGEDRPSIDGPSQRAALEAQLQRTGVAEAVMFLGSVTQTELLALYRRASICVVPSLLYESFSYTCAQAMAAGRPVVASHIGGIPETVGDGEAGLLVPPGDASALADGLLRLLRDPALRARLGAAGRDKVLREYAPERVARMNLAVYAVAKDRFREAAR